MQALCARALFALIPEATTVMVPRLLLSSAGCLGACCRGGSGSHRKVGVLLHLHLSPIRTKLVTARCALIPKQDMFCGSGTVLVEGRAAGKDVIGCDVSPLALFAAAHHTDAHRLDLDLLLAKSRELAHGMKLKSETWKYLRSRIASLEPGALRDALHFVLLVSLSRARDRTYLHSSSKEWGDRGPGAFGAEGTLEEDLLEAPALFHGVAQLYAARIRSLRKAMPSEGEVQIHRCDNRILQLPEKVDAIITGPPYPGVYDYHEPASASADLLGGQILYDFCAPGSTVGGGRVPTVEDQVGHLGLSSSEYAPGLLTFLLLFMGCVCVYIYIYISVCVCFFSNCGAMSTAKCCECILERTP